MSARSLPRNWISLGPDWDFSVRRRRFESPHPHGNNDPFLTADRSIQDGWIESVVTFPNDKFREASFVFRFQEQRSGYIAGIGAFNAEFYIAKLNRTGSWTKLRTLGDEDALKRQNNFKLRVEFEGSKIRLKQNGVLVIECIDETHSTGRIGLQAASRGVVFSNVQVSPRRCVVVMPFSSELDRVFEVVRSAAERAGVELIRADKKQETRPVMSDLVTEVNRADLLIIDLTDQRPNVYYEAGLAHALNKSYIMIAESDRDVTFDVRQMRVLFYGDRRVPKALEAELEQWIQAALRK